jgi:small subunit ribosomal protein S17
MADEERNETAEETPDEAPAPEEAAADAPAEEAAPAEGVPAEEAPAEEAPAEEAPAEDEAAPDAPSDEAAAEAPEAEQPEAGDDAEPVTPKQRRKLARSRAAGEPRPERDPSERATERARRRDVTAASRRRYRLRSRERRGGSGEGTAPAERPPGPKKVRLGRVVSTKGDKTITVQIELARRHPTYEKVVRRSATLHAHDAENTAAEGDTVRVVETRPLSKTKRWRLLEIVERAR